MKQFLVGILVGSALTATVGLAGQFYDRNGLPSAPSGSLQQFDYFRQRQQSLDLNAMRRTQEEPCAR